MSSNKQWTSANWEPNDHLLKSRLIGLLKAEYGESDVATPEYHDWQFVKNPCGPAVMKIAVGAAGEIAGQYVVVPIRLCIAGNVHDGGLSLLTLTDKNFRGQGIFTGLANEVFAECARRGLDFVIGFPNQNSYPGFVGKLQFADLGEVALLLKILKPSGLARAKFGGVLGGLSAAADPLFAPRAKPSDAIVEIKEFDDSFDAFDSLLAKRFVVHQSRTSAFLTWRFRQNPRRYTAFGCYEGSQLKGYVVARTDMFAGFASGLIVDFFVDDSADATAVGTMLVDQCMSLFKKEKIHLAGSLACGGTAEFEILKKRGFFVCPSSLRPQPFPVIFRATDLARGFALPTQGLSGWALTMGDYDAV